MCFRLLAAVQTEGHPPEEFGLRLQALGVAEGLDIRVAPGQLLGRNFVEVAWGDCACSLYTGRAGRVRVVAFVEAISRWGQVQLLLLRDGDPLAWATDTPIQIAAEVFREEALACLPEGRVANLA